MLSCPSKKTLYTLADHIHDWGLWSILGKVFLVKRKAIFVTLCVIYVKTFKPSSQTHRQTFLFSSPALCAHYFYQTQSGNVERKIWFMILYFFRFALAKQTYILIIGPDHWQSLSLTPSVTNSVPFSRLDLYHPGVWRCQLKTCWGRYCWWCWWWGKCWQ